MVRRRDQRKGLRRLNEVGRGTEESVSPVSSVVRFLSERKRKHQPPEHDGGHDEAGEQHAAEPELLRGLVPRDEREDERYEKREECQQEQVTVHVTCGRAR